MSDAFETLQKSPLFKDFTDTGIRIFAAVAVEKNVPAGSPLFVESMVGESLYIVKSGTVRVTHRGTDGEKELATLGPGEHLGELSLLAPSVRLVSALAATPCSVVEIAHRDFVRLSPQKPQACLKLAMAVAADFVKRSAEGQETLKKALSRTA